MERTAAPRPAQPPPPRPSPSSRLWLAAILVLGTALRLVYLTWGLPRSVFFDTQLFYVGPASEMLNGSWIAKTGVHPPLTGGLIAASSLLIPESLLDLSGYHGEARLVLIGRLLTVTFSTASIGAIYVLTRRLLGVRPALLASAALALAPLSAIEAHRVQSDTLMVFLWILAADQAVLARTSGSRRRLWWSFALSGLSGAVKYTGLASGSVPAWIALTWKDRPLARRAGMLLLGACATLLAFLIGISPLLVNPGPFLRSTSTILRVAGTAQSFLGDYAWWFVPYAYALVAALPYAMGWALYLCGLCGFVLLARIPRARGPVLAAAIPFFLLQGAAETGTPRYYLPLVPFFCIAAGAAFDLAWRRWRRLGPALVAVALGYTALVSVGQCLRIEGGPARVVFDDLYARRQTAKRAGRSLTIAYPNMLQARYDPIRPVLFGRGSKTEGLPPIGRHRPAEETKRAYRQWLQREGVDIVVLTSWAQSRARVGGMPPSLLSLETALESGELGYDRVIDAETSFPTQSWYLWADPTFDTNVSVGIVGYKVYARRDAPPR